MAIEESHPLYLVPDLVDRLTEKERRVALQRWDVVYGDANRLVHPHTRRRSPVSIARPAILAGVNARYGGRVAVSLVLAVPLAGAAVTAHGTATVALGLADLAALTIALTTGISWRRRRRMVRHYFAEHFPDGPTTLPARTDRS